jgi:hypothetical protein
LSQETLNILLGSSIIACFIFYLNQISMWTEKSFRWGLVVSRFYEAFPVELPKHFTNKTIEIWGVSFKFVSQDFILFRKTSRETWESWKLSRLRREQLPVLLGEIFIDKTGTAQIALRIPFSLIFLYISLLIVVTYGVTIINSVVNGFLLKPYQFIIILIIFSAFIMASLLTEIDRARSWINKFNEYIAENA